MLLGSFLTVLSCHLPIFLLPLLCLCSSVVLISLTLFFHIYIYIYIYIYIIFPYFIRSKMPSSVPQRKKKQIVTGNHLLSHVHFFSPLWSKSVACQAPLSSTISQSLPKFMSIESVLLSNHLIPPPSTLPLIFPSIRVFTNESTLHIRSFSFSYSSSSEYSGLISFRIDWFDLAVQGTLKTLIQHHSSKASVLWFSAFFRDQLSHPYVTIAKKKKKPT